ncbi:hypothetical protein KVR01_012402 [Diaporthe batatas]|uniref:uncharacterized protein n=1 Tax=Diaporthe batatas TaxID=748121 RepID=UPI001D03C543|nr:uncharacterized protein KVR01_012402 [Diaporthe batatas]KAG8157740.1 hypothetical protein KVR01_012402 [Diaporthe batatas]
MKPNIEVQSPQPASRMPVTMTMQQVRTLQTRTLEALVSQFRHKLWDIYGQSTMDVDGWQRATVLEWQALVNFHLDLAGSCLLLLLMTQPFQSSIGLSREIWQSIDAFFYLHSRSQSAPAGPAVAMVDMAACVMALLYFYEPTDRENCFQNLRDLGRYRRALSTQTGDIAEQLTWALVARSDGAFKLDTQSAVKSLLQLESIRNCGKRIDRIVVGFVFGLYVNSLPNRGSMEGLFFSPANCVYKSVLDTEGKSKDEAACTNVTTVGLDRKASG